MVKKGIIISKNLKIILLNFECLIIINYIFQYNL